MNEQNVLARIVLDGKPCHYNVKIGKPKTIWSKKRNKFVTISQFYNPNADRKEAEQWRVKLAYRGQPYPGKVQVQYNFYFKPPASMKAAEKEKLYGTTHAKKPDVDNLTKFYGDVIKGILIVDDQQITKLLDPGKYYGKEEKTEIIVFYE